MSDTHGQTQRTTFSQNQKSPKISPALLFHISCRSCEKGAQEKSAHQCCRYGDTCCNQVLLVIGTHNADAFKVMKQLMLPHSRHSASQDGHYHAIAIVDRVDYPVTDYHQQEYSPAGTQSVEAASYSNSEPCCTLLGHQCALTSCSGERAHFFFFFPNQAFLKATTSPKVIPSYPHSYSYLNTNHLLMLC